MPAESLMLTGDENIVDLNFSVQWRVSDAAKYLFNVRDRDEDSQAGITTLSKVIGHGRLRVLYVALVTLSVLSLAGLAAFGPWPKALLAAPLLLVLLAKPIACVVRNQRLADIDAQTARFETVLLAAMILACALH